MIRYTIQNVITDHPMVVFCVDIKEVNRIFNLWCNDPRTCPDYILVWRGEVYPVNKKADYKVSYGPRMGIRWERC